MLMPMPDRSTVREGHLPFKDSKTPALMRSSPDPTVMSGKPGTTGSSVANGIDQALLIDRAGDGEVGAKPDEARPRKDSASQLSQYREQLARDMQRNVLGARPAQGSTHLSKRVSPIQEESAVNSPSQISSGPSTTSTNASTESGQTVRGVYTPGFMPKTPSYPFPRVGTPGYTPSSLHKPFTTLSPTGSAPDSPTSSAAATATFGNSRARDNIMSNPTTPASAMAFRPEVVSQTSQHGDNLDFPTPNLYELSLRLSSEPGLEAWWKTVVQIMTEEYQAERLTIAVPADATDLENVPWGQKATYNARQEDGVSMGYLARGSSAMPSSRDVTSRPSSAAGEDAANLRVPLRPRVSWRHSYTEFEAEKAKKVSATGPTSSQSRPGLVPRSQTFYPGSPYTERSQEDTLHMGLNKQALEEHDAEEPEAYEEWEAPGPEAQNQGRVFETLQALDYEADPLIDHHGVVKVLERGRVIALTRSYPYEEDPTPPRTSEVKGQGRSHSPDGQKKKGPRLRHESSTKLSNILSSAHSMNLRPHDRRSGQQNIDQMISEGEPRRPPTPSYEEFEQAPPSPWSQSPVNVSPLCYSIALLGVLQHRGPNTQQAPSPAIRPEAKENPFFNDSVVDESSFDPAQSSPDYTAIGPQEAIGCDNSWTVLHIPLKHPVLSKSPTTFKLDPKLMEQKSSRRGKDIGADKDTDRNSEHEVFRKDKQTPIAILSILSSTIPYPSNLRYSLEHLAPHLATSFSLCRHYSTLESEVTRMHHRRPRVAGFGAVDSDGRPIADPATVNYVSEEGADQSRAGSLTSPSEYSTQSRSAAGTPGGTPGWESLAFGLVTDKRPGVPSPAPASGDSYFTTKSRTAGKTENSSAQQRVRRGSKGSATSEKRSSLRLDSGRLSPDVFEAETSEDPSPQTGDDVQPMNVSKRLLGRDTSSNSKDERATEARASHKTTQTPQRHKKLHSYGGDFATTFQSLPPGSKIPVGRGAPLRSDSTPVNPPEMAWPTDRLRELILDSLPAQLFVAGLPGGGIVWVNSRYIAYRGQTLAELYEDPYASIHPDDRETYLSVWGRAVRTGEDFQMTVRIRRFDGAYRCFSARVVACRNRRNEIVYYLGSYTDIHEQTVAELKVVRQQEIEASEAKHRLLANLIPEIIFTATEDEGITFSNEQWLSYTGQSEEDALGLGFMGFVHPDDLAKCHLPSASKPPTPAAGNAELKGLHKEDPQLCKAGEPSGVPTQETTATPLDSFILEKPAPLSRHISSGSEIYGPHHANLTELAKTGIVKVGRDSSGRLTYTTEIRLRSKTGEYRWHLVRCVEIDKVSVGSGASSYFGSATDINDHKLLETKLKEAMESKSRFLSNMSHEIRTPLIGISGMVSFLQDTTLNDEQRDYTNTIQTSANSLLMIINDILDLSKVDAGMMKLKHEWFHTRALIEDVNELVSAMAIARRLELNYLVDEDVPTYIKGDKVRIRQVLLNVIGNAVKFTETGEVFSRCRVKIGASGLQENEVMLEFAVIDTGRGFTEEERKLIFKPFSQIDGSSTRAHGGSGLGLVISRQLVELHGGIMEGTAVPGEGATFTFTAKFSLPTEEDRPDAPKARVPVSTVSTPAVIEDIPTQPFRQFTITKRNSSKSVASPVSTTQDSPAVASSGSSVPSVTSTGTRGTQRSSISSVNGGLARFSEAARASGQDLTQMKLEMPSGRSSPKVTPTGRHIGEKDQADTDTIGFRPPMFSILVICPQTYSRKATTRHVEMTLPRDVPHQITPLSSAQEAEALIGREDPVIFTHIIINLASVEEILHLISLIYETTNIAQTSIVLLTDSIQRQDLTKLVADTSQERLVSNERLTFVYKPVKPSRLAVIFDPGKEGDASVDRNRSTAQRLVEDQKKSYLEVEKRMGNKGYKVLLVEDNPVNQKVLNKYLAKVGLEVDIAMDGLECTEKVFAHPMGFYSLILVSTTGASRTVQWLSKLTI